MSSIFSKVSDGEKQSLSFKNEMNYSTSSQSKYNNELNTSNINSEYSYQNVDSVCILMIPLVQNSYHLSHTINNMDHKTRIVLNVVKNKCNESSMRMRKISCESNPSWFSNSNFLTCNDLLFYGFPDSEFASTIISIFKHGSI